MTVIYYVNETCKHADGQPKPYITEIRNFFIHGISVQANKRVLYPAHRTLEMKVISQNCILFQ